MMHWHPRRVGLFVLGALLLALVGVMSLGGRRWFTRGPRFVSYFSPGAAKGLRIGSAVRFRGIPVGEVTSMHVAFGRQGRDTVLTTVPVIYEIDERRIARDVPDFAFTPAFVDSLVQMGLRARLETESFVTGVKYIDLEFRPEVTALLVRDPAAPNWEIPVVPQSEIDLQAEVTDLLSQIAKIDFQRLAAQLDSTLSHFNALFGDIQAKRLAEDVRTTLGALTRTSDSLAVIASRTSAEVGPAVDLLRERAERLDSTLAAVDSTLAAARVALDPESPTLIHLQGAMKDLSGASRSLQALTEYLERNPGALLRGRPPEARP